MCKVDCGACHDRRMPIFCLITMYVQKGHIYHKLVQSCYRAQDTTISGGSSIGHKGHVPPLFPAESHCA